MSSQLPIKIKADFPILGRQVQVGQNVSKPLAYLDSAATSQKPQQVIDAISNYYQNHNANVHRGVHTLADESTQQLEESRHKIAAFFGAKPEELIITRNSTEALNGIAYGWAERSLQPGDIILTTLMEHHANVLPWQEVARRHQAKVEFINVTPEGELDLADFQKKINQPRVRLVAVAHVSNTLGTINPVVEMVKSAKKASKKLLSAGQRPIRVVVDGAQSAPHLPVNFHELGADFYVFSGHKMLGPMGVGGILVRQELLEEKSSQGSATTLASNATPSPSPASTPTSAENNPSEFRPWLFGGGMIAEVATSGAEFSPDLAERFTAGTPDVASTVGLAAACDYLTNLGMKNVLEHDLELVDYALSQLSNNPRVTIIGPVRNQPQTPENCYRAGSVAFLYRGAHAHDIAQILNSEGVAVRSGHHCTMPLHTHFGWVATIRASFNVYNSKQDIDALVSALQKVDQVLGLK
ncbi:MAG: aminotransferase class V-fold PLP-dependent enzyme [Patescibacteria group bacterium]